MGLIVATNLIKHIFDSLVSSTNKSFFFVLRVPQKFSCSLKPPEKHFINQQRLYVGTVMFASLEDHAPFRALKSSHTERKN